MIRPIVMYCHQLQLGMPKGTIDKLQSIQNRAAKIVSPRDTPDCWETITEMCNRRAATDVYKCLNGLSPEQFMQYFKRHHHEKGTRGSNSALTLPLNRTEPGKRTFVFQGAKLFDKLPKKVRDK